MATLTDDILSLLPDVVRTITFRNEDPLEENADSRLRAVDIVSMKTTVEAMGVTNHCESLEGGGEMLPCNTCCPCSPLSIGRAE